ncbi:glycosyltransferase [Desulfobacterales bacterium HSG2]|nr:glycosyltransferase [Desulfobacterales bacterium HSG2]
MFKIITMPFNRNIENFDEDLLNHFSVDKYIRSQAEFFAGGTADIWRCYHRVRNAIWTKAMARVDFDTFSIEENLRHLYRIPFLTLSYVIQVLIWPPARAESQKPELKDRMAEPEDREAEDRKPEIKDRMAEAEDRKPELKDRMAEAEDRKPELKDRMAEAEDRKPEPEDRKPEPEDRKPEPEDRKPEPEDRKPEPEDRKPEPEDRKLELKTEPEDRKPEIKDQKSEIKDRKPEHRKPELEDRMARLEDRMARLEDQMAELKPEPEDRKPELEDWKLELETRKPEAKTRYPEAADRPSLVSARFSVLVPTYNSHLGYFRELTDSLKAQTYDHFEVCVSDDASTDAMLEDYLKDLAENDSRFRVMFWEKNGGIAENTNRAMNMARGDFLVLCDHDDRMDPFALEAFAEYVSDHPESDVIYTDEDMIDTRGFRHSPRFQTDWNPDLLTSHMYCPHLIAVRTSLAKDAGLMEPLLDGAQDYDFFLRVTEKARHVGHIPLILYSWRSAPGSIAMDCAEKMYAYEAGRIALENAMERRGEDAVVVKVPGTNLGVYRVKRKVSECDVSHIVEGRTKDVITAVRSIRLVSPVPVEILVVTEDDRDEVSEVLEKERDVKLIIGPKGSGRAGLYNQGAGAAQSRFLFFSGHNVEILDSEYPLAALEHTRRPEIGAVGVKLSYPNGRFYHTGMIMGVNGLCGYAHRNTPHGPGYFNYAACIRNYTAVSWDLMAVDKRKWEEAGGFDETLPFYGDIDFCLKLIREGYRNLYTPYISGVLKSRVHGLEELRNKEAAHILIGRYGSEILEDPFYHPLLSKLVEDFSVARNSEADLESPAE